MKNTPPSGAVPVWSIAADMKIEDLAGPQPLRAIISSVFTAEKITGRKFKTSDKVSLG